MSYTHLDVYKRQAIAAGHFEQLVEQFAAGPLVLGWKPKVEMRMKRRFNVSYHVGKVTESADQRR